MSFISVPISEFIEALSSKSPVPGGGGAAALVGAVGAALGGMVAGLTIGKKKYARVEEEMLSLRARACELQTELLRLIDADADAFGPLSEAYGIPKDDPGRGALMEAALKTASAVPLEIMRVCAKAIDLTADLAAKGSVLAVSDAGCGAAFLKAALVGASLNVFINTKAMADRAHAEALENEARALLDEYAPKAEAIGASVLNRISNK